MSSPEKVPESLMQLCGYDLLQDISYPPITTRAMVDVGRKCNASCEFCYYHHLGDLTKQTYKPVDLLIDEIYEARKRGCDYIDFSGGEPTLHPEMAGLVKTVNAMGMKCCIITNALCGKNTLQKLLDAGVDDWLISMHGFENVHNELVGIPEAREHQLDFVQHLQNAGKDFRVNCVINQKNQDTLARFAGFLANAIKPRIVNFINFNPHGDWAGDSGGTRRIVANLFTVERQLFQGIRILEDAGIGVNVRYYPMCRIASEYRRCVCNDLHVMFDPYEWDNGMEHTKEVYRKWSINTSACIEWKGEPCQSCSLLDVCGGINRALNCATMGEYPEAVFDPNISGIFHYRKDNLLTLQKRGA